MAKQFYSVYFQDEEDMKEGIFRIIPLEMCRPGRHCGCFDRGDSDICDHMFIDTEDITLAQEKVLQLRAEGYNAWFSERRKPIIVKKIVEDKGVGSCR